jgi:hypothetical protein
MKNRVSIVLILGAVGILFAWQGKNLLVRAQQDHPQLQSAEASSAMMGAPTRVVIPMTDRPPVRTMEEQQRLEVLSANSVLPMPALPVGTTAVQRPDSVISADRASQVENSVEFSPQAGINAPGDTILFRSTTIPAADLAGLTYLSNSPSAANNEFVVFETGNWYGAVSANGGKTFKYVDPTAVFPPSYGGFCCNQVVIYVPSRDIFIWEMEYSPNTDQGALRIAVSRGNDAVKGIWYFYDLPAGSGFFFNFSDLALSNDFLYITTNHYTLAGSFDSTLIYRWPLDPLLEGVGFDYLYINRVDNFNFRPVQGATDTIYWAAHNSTSQVRVFSWYEDSGSYVWNDVDLSAPWNNSVRTCPGPDGRDWCGQEDGRILTGWVGRGILGFMWSASQGGGFAYPYIEALTVKATDLSYNERPIIYNPVYAFMYPAAAVNARGDVGIVFNFGGGSYYPTVGYGVYDDFSTIPYYFEIHTAGSSTQGPNVNNWGRYYAVRPFAPAGLVWSGTGFTLNGCGDNFGCANPMYFIFGRERDMRSLTRYWDQNYGVFTPLINK